MGDLNYRLDVDAKPSTLASTIQNDYAALVPHDQLVKLRDSGGAFSDFHEGRIDFPPTYKYKKGGSQFNWKRTPAWCDRILCRGDCAVSSYACVSETTCSDHKPVMAVVELQLKEFDEEKKKEAKEKIEKRVLQTEEGNVCVRMSTHHIQFGVVRVGTPQHQRVVLKNEGEANAYFRVAGELAASPARGLVLPGDSVDVGYPGSTTRAGRVGAGVAHDAASVQGIVERGGRIRRLMPRECLRLQGFEDEQIDRILAINSDAQAYKQAGNSVTVTVIEAIGRRIRAVDEALRKEAAA